MLKAANVKATFFVVGVNAARYPALVRRSDNNRHEIGNHTNYHPNLALCWTEHIRLPRILDWLHTRGDSIVPLSTLLGTTRDAVMPLVQGNGQSLARIVSSTGFRVYHSIEEFLWAFMIVATALVVVRTLIVIWLAARFRRGPRTDFAQPISVVIAAYNEEKVIAETLRTLLATDYKGEIQVVAADDGSRDQ